MFKLTIEDDEGKTTVVPIARDEMTIGRLDGNTIRLTERNVSRKHARLLRQNGALYIEDLSSYTGVRVNGAKIADRTALRDGDELQIGDYRLALHGERGATVPIADRPTMPSIAAVNPAPAPMGTVGGSVAIPGRASVAAMAAQPQPLAAPTPTSPLTAVPAAAVPVPAPIPIQGAATAPMAAPAPVAAPNVDPGATPAPEAVAAPLAAGPATPGPAAGPATPGPGPSGPPAGAPPPGTPPSQVVTLVAAPPPGASARKSAPVPSQAPAQETPPPEVSESQPTIPIRALGDTVPDPTATAVPARIFALTTELAGAEFALDRPSQVIGRTDENDIVLGHRSISRHHAKIVRDGENYTIVDLQSANGVRVNGEDYERIELRSGDVIELGHVKLRFVGPQESYVFRAQSGARWRGPAKMVAATAALTAVLVAGASLYKGARNRSAKPVAVASTTPPPAPVAAIPAPAPPAAPAPAAPAAPVAPAAAPAAPEATPVAILAEAKKAAGAEDWDKARGALDRLGTTIENPIVRRDAIALRKQIDTERQGAALFTQFDEAASEKNYAEAMDRYDQIPVTSVYKRRAKPRYDEARALLVAEHLSMAEKARNAGRCAEVKAAAAEVARLDPRNQLGKEMVRLCRARPEPAAATAAAKPARAKPSPLLASAEGAGRVERAEPARRAAPVAAEPAARKTAPAVADPKLARAESSRAEASGSDNEDSETLMKQAREAWLRQQCGAAVDLSRKALHAKPGLTDAYQIIAVCSCTLKDADAANRAYTKLDDRNRNLVHTLCLKNGINVGE